MAKDDYFVIVYRILTYLYVCLKAGAEPDLSYISANSVDLGIHPGYWEYIIRHLYQDGYLEGVSLFPVVGRKTPGIKLNDVMITPKGIEFLQENSMMEKVKDFFKSVKETVPGL